MLSFRDGDEDAFETLYRRYEKPLLNFLYRMVMNAVDAENLCQETFFCFKITPKFISKGYCHFSGDEGIFYCRF